MSPPNKSSKDSTNCNSSNITKQIKASTMKTDILFSLVCVKSKLYCLNKIYEFKEGFWGFGVSLI